ncbi:MAG: hypothetical protein KKD33_07065 [Verrucomicrobia bacterium]|nr:hypothetical protein [Verrucomicrobiota bacterium]
MSVPIKVRSERENYLQAIEFRCPAWIPINYHLYPSLHARYGERLRSLQRRHPLIFDPADIGRESVERRDPLLNDDTYSEDDWGCTWHNARGGTVGQVVKHPLADWSDLHALRIPNPEAQEDWAKLREEARRTRDRGKPVIGGPRSFATGGFFDRLHFLRGLENFCIDLLTDPPELAELIQCVLDYNLRYIRLWLETGVDVMYFHGDLGTQNGLLISPEAFRKHLKPAYREMFQMCRAAGVHVHYSSDGNILEIVDDLIECGVSLHDPQVGANGIDAIARAYKGRLCAMVDIDEQRLPLWTPNEVEAQVREIVQKVATPEGGLMLLACPTEDVPLENLEAICTAWEKHGRGR